MHIGLLKKIDHFGSVAIFNKEIDAREKIHLALCRRRFGSERIRTTERLGDFSDFLNSKHGRRFLFPATDLGKTLFDFFGAALRHVAQSTEDQDTTCE